MLAQALGPGPDHRQESRGLLRERRQHALAGATVADRRAEAAGRSHGEDRWRRAFWIPALPPGGYSLTVPGRGFTPRRGRSRCRSIARDRRPRPPAGHRRRRSRCRAPRLSSTRPRRRGTSYTSKSSRGCPSAQLRRRRAVEPRGGHRPRRHAGPLARADDLRRDSAENQYIIDGVNTTGVKGHQAKALNNEFVQEVEVKTGGYEAEYGRALGGDVNVVTKSGGNEFHGDAFGYYDSTGTSPRTTRQARGRPARRRALTGQSTERVDFGADLGGYFVKDRLWFFGAYDRIDLIGRRLALRHRPSSRRRHVPDRRRRQHLLGQADVNVSAPTTIVGSVFADPVHTSGAAGADPRQRPRGPSSATPRSPQPGSDVVLDPALGRHRLRPARPRSSSAPPASRRCRALPPATATRSGVRTVGRGLNLRGRQAREYRAVSAEPRTSHRRHGWIDGQTDQQPLEPRAVRRRLHASYSRQAHEHQAARRLRRPASSDMTFAAYGGTATSEGPRGAAQTNYDHDFSDPSSRLTT